MNSSADLVVRSQPGLFLTHKGYPSLSNRLIFMRSIEYSWTNGLLIADGKVIIENTLTVFSRIL
jgi:hypothetical protein